MLPIDTGKKILSKNNICISDLIGTKYIELNVPIGRPDAGQVKYFIQLVSSLIFLNF